MVIPCYFTHSMIFNGEEIKETKYKGYYVTKTGKVLSAKVKGGRGSISLSALREHCYRTDKDGYAEVLLSGEWGRKYYRVHRLIWETFNGIIKNNLTVDHIDKNIKNNNINNLRLLTREKNASIAHKGILSPKKHYYKLNSSEKHFTRKEIQDLMNKSEKMWYTSKYILKKNVWIVDGIRIERIV